MRNSKGQSSEDISQSPTSDANYTSRASASESEHIVTSDNLISQPEKSQWKHLFAFTRWSHAGSLAAALASSALTAGLKTLLPVILGQVFDVIGDYGIGARDSESTIAAISKWSVILIGVGVGNWMANSAFLALWITFGELQANSIRRETFESLLSKEIAWFDAQDQGISSLLVRIQTYANP